MPRQFVEFGLGDNALENVSKMFPPLPNGFKPFEATVDDALPEGPGPPKSFRCRCSPMRAAQAPICLPVEQACPSAYEPSTEVLSMSCRRQVAQVRRLESLQ